MLVIPHDIITATSQPDSTQTTEKQIDFKGYVQYHWIFDGKNGVVPDNQFLLRRARLTAEPQITEILSVAIEIDVGKSKISTKDAFIEYKYSRALRIILGQHKIPFSRERLTSSSKILFIERSTMNDVFEDHLWLGRDIGLSMNGRIISSEVFDVNYFIGAYNGTGGAVEYNNAKQYVQRLTFDISKRFSIGVNSSQRTDSITAKVLTAHGADISYKGKNIIFETELLYGNRTLSDRMVGGYVQLYHRISRFEWGVRFEKLREDVHTSISRSSITGGMGIHVNENLRLRTNIEQVQPKSGNSYVNVFTQVQAAF